MTAEGWIFTAEELMVLLSVLGAPALYGFWAHTPEDSGKVLTAANRLTARGVLTAGTKGFQLAEGELRPLLAPLCAPERVFCLSPKEEGRPQVCYALAENFFTGCEAVLVQSGAVRLFSRPAKEWLQELEEREVLSPLARRFPAARRRIEPLEPLFDRSAEELLEWPGASFLLEEWDPQSRQVCRRTLITAGPGGEGAVVCTPEKSVRTNDAAGAVALTAPQEEDEP